MKIESNVDFWMYTGDRFLMYAEEYLKLLEEPEVIEEAQDVRRVNNYASLELEKFIQSLTLSSELRKTLNDFEKSMQENRSKANDALEAFKTSLNKPLSKSIEALQISPKQLLIDSLTPVRNIRDVHLELEPSQEIKLPLTNNKDSTDAN